MTRAQKATTWQGTTATCTHCQTAVEFSQTQILRGDGEIEMEPCHLDECAQMLCPSCDQFNCAGCGLAHCREHAVDVAGELFCPLCVKGMEEDGEPICSQPVALLAQMAAKDGMALLEAGVTVEMGEAIRVN